ncbi:MAG: hypothetical protein KDA31_09595 [Phycisphaerales bacterium]|nr:hypothetical protein [Phycisphaerales bacterium]MCB9836435.1 hypothetical protein [Phycisphaera sp.]
MSHRGDPSETYFGISVGADPFALLGLPRRPVADNEVLQALGTRMSAIAGHARGQTPEANEIRLALHAAAAQLLDPQLQKLLLTTSGNDESQLLPEPVPEIPSPTIHAEEGVRESSEPIVHPLSHDVLLVVAANGGWNATAMRRLAMLAHARGIASHEIPEVISSVLANPMRSATRIARSAPASDAETTESPRIGSVLAASHIGLAGKASIGARLAPWVIGSITLVSLVLIWVRLTSSDADQRRNVPDGATAATSESAPSQAPTASVIPETIPTRMTPRDATRRISQLASDNRVFGDAELTQFRTAYESFSREWTSLSADQIGAVHDALLELLYRNSANPGNAQAILDVIGASMRSFSNEPEGFRAWVMSVATMSRLSMERNLPTSIDSAIIGRLTAALGQAASGTGQSFDDAVLLALNESATKLAATSESDRVWRVWLEQLAAVTTAGDDTYTAAVLDAIEQVMLTSEDPSQSRPVFQSLESLASAIKLDRGNQVSKRLLDWFANSRVTTSDLTVVMRPLIARSRADGIDESLIPPVGMGEAERGTLRSRLESVLLGKDAESVEAVASWMSIADQQLARSQPRKPAEIVARAVILSRLSAAARATLWGDRKLAESTLANLTGDVDQLISNSDPEPVDYLGGTNADEWAVKYIDAKQNIPIRQALLGELARNKRTLGPVAAEVIVRDAFLGTPATVRAQAREVVRLYADSPAILNGILEYLPRIPKIESSSELIEVVAYTRLPSVKSPAWSARARQACVDELLRRLAGIGEGQIVDSLANLLNESYGIRLGGTAASSQGSDAIDLAQSASELSSMWRRLAEQEVEEMSLLSDLEDLDHRSVGRLLLAEGSLDQFAAHQVTAVECMAILVIAENPGMRDEVESIQSELAQARRSSKNILEQITATETAAVKLWRLRLGRSVS